MAETLKARFHLPGLRYNYPLNMFWISLLKTKPEFFREEVEVASVFGCFPYALWNGGRLCPPEDQCDKAFIRSVIKNINAQGLPVRYTFTNPLLEEADLRDPFCNFCMEAGDNGKNEVLVFSPLLEEYLRTRYPSYAYDSTTCKEIRDVDDLNAELERDYKYVVLDYNLNNHWELLSRVEHPEKLEILINSCCTPACKRRGEHYRQIARDERTVLMNRTLPPEKRKPTPAWTCQYGDRAGIPNIKDYPTFVSPEMIREEYLPRGINNFKIEGRTANLFSLIETYCYYMIKPECVIDARLLLLRNLEESHIIQVNRPRPQPFT